MAMTLAGLNRHFGAEDRRRAVWLYDGAKDIRGSSNVADALEKSGMNWQVEQEPLMNPRTGEKTRYVMNFRNDTNGALGIVGAGYKPIQNQEAFDFIDQLSPLGMTFETIGMTDRGNQMWMCVRLNEAKLLGDAVSNYVVLTNSHDGSGSMKVTMSPMRQACNNCLSWIFRTYRERTQSIRHSGDVSIKLAEAQHVYGLAEAYMEHLALEAEELSQIKVATPKFIQLTEALFPPLAEDSAKQESAKEQHRYFLRKAWEQDDLGDHRGTGWGVINAVADFEQHNYRKQQGAFNTVLDGSKLVQRSYEWLQQ